MQRNEVAKKERIEEGGWRYYWDEEWWEIGRITWPQDGSVLYVDEEKGWAKGTFGKVINHNFYYHMKPVYRFSVVEPDMNEKEIVVEMGYLEDQSLFSWTNCPEGCWSEKITFKPGSKVVEGTVIRDYKTQYMEVPSSCYRRSPPY